MTPAGTRSTATRLRAVGAAELPEALRTVLDGGAPVVPLPPEPVVRAQVEQLLEQSPEPRPDTAVVVWTSGSTAEPKGVELSGAAVRAGAEATHERLGGPGHWLLALPTHHVAGLMVLARAQLAGTRVVDVGRDLAGLVDADVPAGRRYLSVVPVQLARALERPEQAAALAGLDAVLVGGGAADPDLLARARAAGIAATTTYGMSETCGGCVYDGRPLDGVDAVVDGPDGGDGRVRLRGPVLFSGYLGRDDLTAETLVDGWFTTADRGRLVEGRLEVLGRTDDVVVSGGENVDLAAVEARAQTWPARALAELVVVGVDHPEWGAEVVAVADARVPRDGLASLQAWVRAALPTHAAPRRLVVLDRLPRTGGDKVDRRTLRAGLGLR